MAEPAIVLLDPAIGQVRLPIEVDLPRVAAMPPRVLDAAPPSSPDAPASPSREHAELRELVHSLAGVDGQHETSLPNLRFYRFSEPTTFSKAPAFGVTLGVVLSGTKDVRVEGTTFRADASRLLVITKETEYERATVGASREEPYVGVSVCFCSESVARALIALSDAGAPSGPDTTPAFVMPSDREVIAAVTRLVRAVDDPVDRQILAPLVMQELLYRLLRSDAAAAVRSAVAREPDAPKILQAMQFIRRESKKPLTVAGIARHVAMSPSHFAHRFRAVARVSPMRFVREVRLARARELLTDTSIRASEVAAEVGFESAAHFSREFKRRYGAAPIAYVKGVRAASVRVDRVPTTIE